MTLSIDRMYAYIAVGEEGEGIAAAFNPDLGGWMPLVGADMARMISLEPIAQELANASGQRIVLSRFEDRTDLQVLEPTGVGNAGTILINPGECVMEIVVVTKVPEPGKESGNLAVAGFDLRWSTGERGDDYLDKTIPFLDALKDMLDDDGRAVGFLLNLRQPVFTLGEIMFLDENGREITGAGRKPSKWYIEVETVDSIEAALTLSLSVLMAEEAKHD